MNPPDLHIHQSGTPGELRADDVIRAVRRACAPTLHRWATRDEIADELAKETFVRDLDGDLESLRQRGVLRKGWPGRTESWQTR